MAEPTLNKAERDLLDYYNAATEIAWYQLTEGGISSVLARSLGGQGVERGELAYALGLADTTLERFIVARHQYEEAVGLRPVEAADA